jgi:SAM-dependent methyltransferase
VGSSGSVGALPLLRPVELTDLIVAYDASTGERLPVRLDAVLERLAASRQRRAARIARRLPVRGDELETAASDALLARVHAELQMPRRVAETVRAWIMEERSRSTGPLRVVDVGCGLGFVTRWLAAYGELGPDVELVGVDLNRGLVERGAALAAAEGLSCQFVVGDALQPGVAVIDPIHTMVVSTGLLHHLSVAELEHFFAGQQRLGVARFAHWDVDPCWIATMGAWVFHLARMREPVSRHDGVLSARRAHPAWVLRAAAAAWAVDYEVSCPDGTWWWPAASQVLRPVIGRRR